MTRSVITKGKKGIVFKFWISDGFKPYTQASWLWRCLTWFEHKFCVTSVGPRGLWQFWIVPVWLLGQSPRGSLDITDGLANTKLSPTHPRRGSPGTCRGHRSEASFLVSCTALPCCWAIIYLSERREHLRGAMPELQAPSCPLGGFRQPTENALHCSASCSKLTARSWASTVNRRAGPIFLM